MNTFPNKWAHLNCEWSIANVKVVQTNNVNIWCLAVYLALYWRRWTGYRFFGPPRACQPACVCVCVCARLLRESSGRRQFCPAAYLARHRLHSRPPSSQVSAHTHTHTRKQSIHLSHTPMLTPLHLFHTLHVVFYRFTASGSDGSIVFSIVTKFFFYFFTAPCYIAMERYCRHMTSVRLSVCLSVCQSVRDVGESWSHTLS